MHIFLDGLETFRMIWKLSGWSGNFPNDLETFQMIWKLSVWFGNFRIVWKLSGWSENFPDGLETFQMAWKLSDDLESVWMIWKLFGGSIFPKCIYPKCIFAKCTPLACFLCFASLLKGRLGCRIWLVPARDVAPRGQISCSADMWISKLHCGAHQMSFQTKSKPGFLPRGLFRGNIFMTRLLRGKCAAAGFSGTMWRYRRWCISKGFDARGREREEARVREFYNKSNSNDVKDEFWCCWVCLVSLL